MEEQKNIYKSLIEDGQLYPKAFVSNWGMAGKHWSKEGWIKRELSLRHDMCCILLCNLERMSLKSATDQLVEYQEAKRRKINPIEQPIEIISNSSIITESMDTDTNTKSSGTSSIHEEDFRYVLIEGMPSENRIINMLAEKSGIQVPSYSYDIFDRLMKQWIEVKITAIPNEKIREYNDRKEIGVNSALICIDPSFFNHKMIDRVEELPGLTKAKDFLMSRKLALGIDSNSSESYLLETEDMVEEVFSCLRLNNDVDNWVESFWSKRGNEPVKIPRRNPPLLDMKEISYLEMANMIEDTSKRECEVMKFNGKILPPPMVHIYQTKFEKDVEIVDEFFERINVIPGDEYAEIVHNLKVHWDSQKEKSTFTFMTKKKCKENYALIAKALGIDAKNTLRNDYCESLKQEEFKGYSKAKYSPWLSQLMNECSLTNDKNTIYHGDLEKKESNPINPMAKQCQEARWMFFHEFGRSTIAEYCSMLKNVYSRLGGAYLERYERGNHGCLMIFPIYSVGQDGIDKTKNNRFVSGLIIRGPHHAKSATDRIPIISIEIMKNNEMGKLYSTIIKKCHIVDCESGFKLIVRQNSVMKQEPSYLAFVHNSTYLTANFIGEIIMQTPTTLRNHNLGLSAHEVIVGCKEWTSERIVESVFMAVLGKSQEEGMFAIIRKIYMTVLALKRNDKPLSRNWKGLVDKLNECLMDSPLALYWAHQIRMSLLALSH
nr:MAG: polymerase-associated protein [Byreska virus]